MKDEYRQPALPVPSVFISPGELSSHMRDSGNGPGEVPQSGDPYPGLNPARGKLANVVPSLAHVLLVAVRLPRYAAEDSAIRIPLLVSAGSNTMRTRACKTPATRRSMLKEWPS